MNINDNMRQEFHKWARGSYTEQQLWHDSYGDAVIRPLFWISKDAPERKP
jgi:hypothetical protein